jgi:3-oxoacyl-[acyl-carrier protein] reductase
MKLGLKDKVATITGGSVGIGLAVAGGRGRAGVPQALVARDLERLSARANEVREEFGVRALGVAADVATAEGCARVIAEVGREYGGCNLLINNAGTGSNETIMEAPDDKWQHYWELHVMAAVRLARGLAPMMRERGGGVILNNASICAAQPLWYEPIYNVTKAALVMLSKNLANELIPWGIRVNALNLGLVLTPDWIKTATELTAGTGKGWQSYIEGVAHEHAPIKRFATPEEVAAFFVFLCSERASYSVGATYYVDGGMLKVVN